MAPEKPGKYSTADYLVVFGPNDTYLAKTPGGILQSSLVCSPALQKNIADAKSFDFVIFPPQESEDHVGTSGNDATGEISSTTPSDDKDSSVEVVTLLTGQIASPDPYIGYTRKGVLGDHKLYQPPEKYYPELDEWLSHRWGHDLQVVSNMRGCWWAVSPSSGNMKWCNLLPPVRQVVKSNYIHGPVRHMALGVNDAYVIVFKDGHAQWDLKNSYNHLNDYLEGGWLTQGNIVYASLSPYQADRFFIAFNDATVLYSFDPSWTTLNEALLENDELRVIVDSDTVRHTNPAAIKPKGGVAKGIAVDVTKNVLSTVIDQAL